MVIGGRLWSFMVDRGRALYITFFLTEQIVSTNLPMVTMVIYVTWPLVDHNHGRLWSTTVTHRSDHGRPWSTTFDHSRPWSTTVDHGHMQRDHGHHHCIWRSTMNYHGRPSNIMVTMVGHGHHFAWEWYTQKFLCYISDYEWIHFSFKHPINLSLNYVLCKILVKLWKINDLVSWLWITIG